jgi:DNA-binding NtrC family response regulator
MVIDDEAVWRDLCSERLEAKGHRVSTCDDCAEALQQIRTERPDLVVLDLRMPISGRSMLQALRQDWPEMPVVIHTVYSAYRADPELVHAAHFAVKSPDLKELNALVAKLFGGGHPATAAGDGRLGSVR